MNENKSVTFEFEGDVMTTHIHGDIDHHSARFIREAMDERIYADRPQIFCINMSRVSFMDSSGLGLILGRFTLCRELGLEFKVVSPSPEVEKILSLAGTQRLITIEKRK